MRPVRGCTKSYYFTIAKYKLLNDMKKTYVSPLFTEVNVATENMIAASVKFDNDTTVDTSQGGQLGNTHRGEWGNLWGK